MTTLFIDAGTVIGLAIGAMIGLIIIFPILFLIYCFFFLSDPERPGGPKFFVKARENMLLYVMYANKFSGRVILPSQTLYVDKKTYEIKEFAKLPVNFPKVLKDNLKPKIFLGMYWIGIPPFYSIKFRNQQWLEWETIEKEGRKIRFRDESTPYLIAKPFEYAMWLKEGEDRNGLPLNVYFTVILKPVHAVLPIFGNDDAYGQVQTLCLGKTLMIVKENTFANLGGENKSPDKIEQDHFSKVICSLNKKIPGRFKENPSDPNNPLPVGIMEALGYEILDAKLDAVEIAGEMKEKLLGASTAEYIASVNASAKAITGEGEKKYMESIAQGEKAKFDVQADFYDRLAKIPGAMDVQKRKETPNLTTLVEGKGKKTSLIVGGGK